MENSSGKMVGNSWPKCIIIKVHHVCVLVDWLLHIIYMCFPCCKPEPNVFICKWNEHLDNMLPLKYCTKNLFNHSYMFICISIQKLANLKLVFPETGLPLDCFCTLICTCKSACYSCYPKLLLFIYPKLCYSFTQNCCDYLPKNCFQTAYTFSYTWMLTCFQTAYVFSYTWVLSYTVNLCFRQGSDDQFGILLFLASWFYWVTSTICLKNKLFCAHPCTTATLKAFVYTGSDHLRPLSCAHIQFIHAPHLPTVTLFTWTACTWYPHLDWPGIFDIRLKGLFYLKLNTDSFISHSKYHIEACVRNCWPACVLLFVNLKIQINCYSRMKLWPLWWTLCKLILSRFKTWKHILDHLCT